MSGENAQQIVGWQEWASLPDLGCPLLRVKIDTGAKTSSLHAWDIAPGGMGEDENGQPVVLLRLRIDHNPENPDGRTREVIAPFSRYSIVSDSSGRKERRPVIRTRLRLGPVERIVEVNLTNREAMRFRMILGRTALGDLFFVDVGRSFLLGRPGCVQP